MATMCTEITSFVDSGCMWNISSVAIPSQVFPVFFCTCARVSNMSRRRNPLPLITLSLPMDMMSKV